MLLETIQDGDEKKIESSSDCSAARCGSDGSVFTDDVRSDGRKCLAGLAGPGHTLKQTLIDDA
jgi:hypothetical protein